MPNGLREVRSQALELPPSDRELLIHDLLASLDESDEGALGVDAAWALEIERRSVEVSAGTAKLVELEDAIKRIRSAAEQAGS